MQRAAFVIVLMVAMHSMLEYPLWYAYFLLPTAFAFGLCLERPGGTTACRSRAVEVNVTRPFVLAVDAADAGRLARALDYTRVVVIFEPPVGAGPLEERIAAGRKSVLFAHHADYAAATVTDHPGEVMTVFVRAPHYLLDSRLMMAWAKALDEIGETDKARYVAARLQGVPQRAGRRVLRAVRRRQVAGCGLPLRRRPPRQPQRATPQLPFQCQAPTRAALRGLPLARRRAPRGGPVARLAAALLEHAHVADHHAAVDRLAHVVDREQADLHGGQRLHLDAGAAERLDLRRAARPRSRARRSRTRPRPA